MACGFHEPDYRVGPTWRRTAMRKLFAFVVAGLLAVSTTAVFAASHAGAKMDDKDKKTDTKKTDGNQEEKKPEPKK